MTRSKTHYGPTLRSSHVVSLALVAIGFKEMFKNSFSCVYVLMQRLLLLHRHISPTMMMTRVIYSNNRLRVLHYHENDFQNLTYNYLF